MGEKVQGHDGLEHEAAVTDTTPLAERVRPDSFDEMVGNQAIVGPGGLLPRMLAAGHVRSCIFHGSPGCGKSCAARIVARSANMPFAYVNATTATTKELRAAIESGNGKPTLIYLDEVQYFNKRQQQTLLSFVEDGSVTLVAATTENPYHGVYKALLSRCLVVEFKPLSTDDVRTRLMAVLANEGLSERLEPRLVDSIAQRSAGDLRRALNLAETLCDVVGEDPDAPMTAAEAASMLPQTNMGSFDTDGDQHYRYKAALQKSIRGSDPDAAVLWLNQMLEGGDLESPSRRMLIMAAEDIGLADPNAVPITLACVQAAERVGLPEARFHLSMAAIYLATAPKSNSVGKAFGDAVKDIRSGHATVVPEHIASEHPSAYLYPHNYPLHWVEQQYMPDDLLGRRYWVPQENRNERLRAEYWEKVKELVRKNQKG